MYEGTPAGPPQPQYQLNEFPEDKKYPQAPPPDYEYQNQFQSAPGYAPVTNQPIGYGQQPTVIFVTPTPLQNPPNDYLGCSVFSCLCCCWCLGLWAIYSSVQCRSAIAAGDKARADTQSSNAKNGSIASIAIGTVLLIIYVILKVYTGQI